MTGSSIFGGVLALASVALYFWSLRTRRGLLAAFPGDKRIVEFARKQAARRGLVSLLVAVCGATIAAGDHVRAVGVQLALGAAGLCLTLAIVSLVLSDVWASTKFVHLDEAARNKERAELERAVRDWKETSGSKGDATPDSEASGEPGTTNPD